MNQTPHFLLFLESRDQSDARHGDRGQWRFSLEAIGGTQRLEASDVEYGVCGERLELLAVVRGLEALDQPSRVTLITASEQVRRGLRYGLEEWRCNAWMWERFGRLVPIKNHDLWQRVDRAARIHEVECRTFRLDSGHPVHHPGSTGAGLWWYHRRGHRASRQGGPRLTGLLRAPWVQTLWAWLRHTFGGSAPQARPAT